MPYKHTDNSTVLQTPLYPGQALKALQLAISQVCLVFRTYNSLLPLCYEKVINFSTFQSLGFVGGGGLCLDINIMYYTILYAKIIKSRLCC